MNSFRQKIKQASDAIVNQLGDEIDHAIILGSGLSATFDHRSAPFIDYHQVPGLEQPGIISHQGKIQRQSIGAHNVAVCQGRLHLYEGYSAQEVAFLVHTLNHIGVKKIILTNAAGSLNPAYQPGDIMVIEDHINATGKNPLIGLNGHDAQRFTDMSQAYNPALAARAMHLGCELKLPMHMGVYTGVLGPSLETSAERRMYRTLGGDAIGMSTVIEAIAANHCTMEVLGLSAITNVATGGPAQQVDTVEDLLKNAAIAASGMKQIVDQLLTGH